MKYNIADLIRPVETSSNYVKLLVYGEPGAGKTTFAATAPKPLFIDCERGTSVLLKNQNTRNTQIIHISTLEQAINLFEWLRTKEADRFESVVVDTVSELQKLFLDDIIKQAAKVSSNFDGYTVPDGGYYRNTQYMRRLLAELLEIPKHIIVLAHAEIKTHNGISKKTPLLTEKVKSGFIALMDVVGYMETQKIEEATVRTIQTLNTPKVEAKSRLEVPDIIQHPDVSLFIDALTKTPTDTNTDSIFRMDTK